VLAAERLAPALIAVAASEPGRFEAVRRGLFALATPTGDHPVSAAQAITAEVPATRPT
jgi:hypothetical protein